MAQMGIIARATVAVKVATKKGNKFANRCTNSTGFITLKKSVSSVGKFALYYFAVQLIF